MLDNLKYEAIGKAFIDAYLARGMGSLSKREIDVLVMHLLHKYSDDVELRSNQELSIELQIPESRVKTLRYDARLRYPPEEKNYVATRLLYALARAKFDADNGRLVFVLEDTYLRNAIQGHLKANGTFADTSFNREIVKVRLEDLQPILEAFYGKSICKSFVRDMKKALEKENDVNFHELKKEFILGAANGLGSSVVGMVTKLLTPVG